MRGSKGIEEEQREGAGILKIGALGPSIPLPLKQKIRKTLKTDWTGKFFQP
jgi:hypothetical protein